MTKPTPKQAMETTLKNFPETIASLVDCPTPGQISAMVYRLRSMSVAAKAYATPAQGLVFSAAFDDAASMLAALAAAKVLTPPQRP